MNYKVLENFEAAIELTYNPYQFTQQQLFDLALRINKKRRFLFVSQVLGKHLAVAPQIPLLTSHLLAHRFLEDRQQQELATTAAIVEAIQTKENLQQALQEARQQPFTSKRALRVIGFAETATALGHGFFENFTGDVQYIHTTREDLVEQEPLITFEEEHSHASTHRLYGHDDFFDGDVEIVLVDDEMTTGKTNINIIQQLHDRFPHIHAYTLVSILDWRSAEQQRAVQQLAQERGIAIHSVSLVRGDVEIVPVTADFPQPSELPEMPLQAASYETLEALLTPLCVQKKSRNAAGEIFDAQYIAASGRFSLTPALLKSYSAQLQPVIEQLQEDTDGATLVIGSGEFMYIPMYIAAELGEHVYFHATTRSPIFAHADSVIYEKMSFQSPEYPGIINYLYNVPAGKYARIILLFERILDEQALAQLVTQLQGKAPQLQVFALGGGRRDTV